jgi:hypothetical protein
VRIHCRMAERTSCALEVETWGDMREHLTHTSARERAHRQAVELEVASLSPERLSLDVHGRICASGHHPNSAYNAVHRVRVGLSRIAAGQVVKITACASTLTVAVVSAVIPKRYSRRGV